MMRSASIALSCSKRCWLSLALKQFLVAAYFGLDQAIVGQQVS